MSTSAPVQKEERSPQEVLERVSEITDVLFQAPHPFFGYLFMLLGPFVLLPLMMDRVPRLGLEEASIAIFWIYVFPTVVFAATSHRLAKLLGGTFNRRRAVFLAAAVLFFQIVIVAVGGLITRRGFVPFADVLIISYAFVLMPHQIALFTTSDHRHFRSSLVALIHPVVGLLGLHYVFNTGPHEIWLSVLLPITFLLTTIYFAELVDTPIRRNTGLSLSEMFRHYLDHLSAGELAAERMLDKVSSEIDAHVGAVAFRKRDGKVKCAFVVPSLHPGPIGHLGGSNMPSKVASAVMETGNILVPHGPATHDFNPTSSGEVERVAEEARRLIQDIEFSARASPMIRQGKDAQVCAQVFGDSVLLTYTSWPKPIDDVDYGVGQAAILSARVAGARDALFIDAHNSLVMGSGAVFPSTTRANLIVALAEEATRAAWAKADGEAKAGYAQDKASFTRMEGIGEQGCQAIVTDVGGHRTAYVLWDGNNMMPEVRGQIRDALRGLVEDFEVMSTDNHSVNAVAGSFNPIGHRLEPERIAAVSRSVVEAAIADLEPVEVGMKTSRIPSLKVLGHWNTMRLVSSVNTIVATIPRAVAAMLILQAALTALMVLGVRAYQVAMAP
jgi:putative membrane protein